MGKGWCKYQKGREQGTRWRAVNGSEGRILKLGRGEKGKAGRHEDANARVASEG